MKKRIMHFIILTGLIFGGVFRSEEANANPVAGIAVTCGPFAIVCGVVILGVTHAVVKTFNSSTTYSSYDHDDFPSGNGSYGWMDESQLHPGASDIFRDDYTVRSTHKLARTIVKNNNKKNQNTFVLEGYLNSYLHVPTFYKNITECKRDRKLLIAKYESWPSLAHRTFNCRKL